MEEQPSLRVIEEISDNDIDFQNNLIEILKKEFVLEVDSYKKNFDAQNFTKASDCVHKLKHKISLLALEQGLVTAATFEKELKKGNTELHQKFMGILNKINVYLYN